MAEGFGLPVIEAMYFGRPIILSNATALPEIGGPDAFYFDDFEPDNMSVVLNNALKSFVENPATANKLKARANMFNWAVAAKKYIEVYRSLY